MLWFISGLVNPFDSILTSLRIGKEDLKYYDLTKLEDSRYGNFCSCCSSVNFGNMVSYVFVSCNFSVLYYYGF